MRDVDLHLRFSDLSKEFPFDVVKLSKNLITIISYIAPEFLQAVEMDLLIVNDIEMAKINGERRGKNRTTDVLSFPLFQSFPPIPHQMIGEVVISIDTLKIQAKEIGHSDLDEFYRLLVHGVLHLFGYDHELSERDEVIMREKEDVCLAMIFDKNGT